LVAGAAVILGIFAAFMIWATFPLLSFAIFGGLYGAIRYGVPALGRAAVKVEGWAVNAVRLALFPVAVWTLRGAQPAGAIQTGRRRRR
jgi:hypothetical protein